MQILRELEKYINQTLGLEVDATPWDGAGGLPFFLRNAYGFFLIQLMGRDFLLMVDAQKVETPPAAIRKQIEQVCKKWPGEMIYVREQVAGYNRNRLVRSQIPFVVPGNQLYLPMLAIDLRERFMAKRAEPKELSPAAQVLALHSIYEHRAPLDGNMTLTEWAGELKYTKMTMTRAFRELRTLLEGEGPPGDLRGKELWERLRPYLRNPVKHRRYYAVELPDADRPFLAGDSALAHYTMMTEPKHETVCMGAPGWNDFLRRFAPVELAQPEPGALEVEIWRYRPMASAHNGVADPLSVYLSYEENADERVEVALEKLLEAVPW